MSSKAKILLLGWDGADWSVIDPLLRQGRMPVLAGLLNRGVRADLKSFPPYLSPMLWNTIATGHHPAEHGIIGFTEWNAATTSIQPISSHARRRKPLWRIFSEQGRSSHVAGWFASHPAEPVNGVCVSEAFGRFTGKEGKLAPGAVFPARMTSDLEGCRVAPNEVEQSLLTWFSADLNPERLARDARAQRLLKHLSELYSIHNAAIDIASSQPVDFLAVYFHFIDWICHDFAEYAPPQMPGVGDADFRLYRQVLDRAYELQDLLMGDLLARLGPETSVMLVSDHGFLSGEERLAHTPSITAGIAAWHRPTGILAAAGPLFREGGIGLGSATLFDIAPSLLHAAGLPVGRDMPGAVLTEALRTTVTPTLIASWEREDPISPLPAHDVTKLDQRELLRTFQELGYVSMGDDPFDNAEELTRRENAWNLGHALLHADRLTEALGYFEEAYFHNPESVHIAVPLARCQIGLGLKAEARLTLATVRDYLPGQPDAIATVAEFAIRLGDHVQTVELLRSDAGRSLPPERRFALLGLALLHLERWSEAEEVAAQWLEQCPASARARMLLLRSLLRAGRLEEAERLAFDLAAVAPSWALAHFSLGQILQNRGRHEDASACFARAYDLRPTVFAPNGRRTARWSPLSSADASPRSVLSFDDFDFSGVLEEDETEKAVVNSDMVRQVREASASRLSELYRRRNLRRRDGAPQTRCAPPVKTAPALSKNLASAVIVSGLPRSGTSLLMQMLVAGGIPVKSDGIRVADRHNPKGFFEWEPVKQLHRHPERLLEAAGHAVKVVSSQLPFVPASLPCKIIWVDRQVEEICRSQEAMILAEQPARVLPPFAERAAMLAGHRDEILAWAEKNGRPLVRVRHARLLREPATVAAELAAFLGDLLPNPGAMAACVDPSLHRQKEGVS